jgi:heme exporter protein C
VILGSWGFVAMGIFLSTLAGEERKRKLAAVFGIIGFIDVPLVYFSVLWWRTIHPKVIDEQGVHKPPEMALTLLFSSITFLLLFFTLLWYRTSFEQMKERVKQLKEKYV